MSGEKNAPLMRRGIIYTRFSTERQQSTQMQIDKCTVYAAANNIVLVGSPLSDEGISGAYADSREKFNEALRLAESGAIDCILIYDIQRGSRDVEDWFHFRKQMYYRGVEVISVTYKLGDLYNPDDYLGEMLNVGLGQHMLLKTRVASIDGKTTKAKAGTFQGGFAPYGYKIVNQEYIIVPDESELVRLIFTMYAAGKSYANIMDELYKRNVKGRAGRPFSKTTLYSILNNERYIGVYSWNKYQNRVMHRWVGERPNPNHVRIENRIPAIVEKSIWDKVRIRMEDHKHNATNKAKEFYPLSGLIECGECGATYIAHTTTNSRGVKTRYYICGNKYRNRSCKAKALNADVLEAETVLQLRAWLDDLNPAEFAAQLLENVQATQKTDVKALREELNGLNIKIARATKILLEDDIISVKDELLKMQARKLQIQDVVNKSFPAELPTAAELAEVIRQDIESAKKMNPTELIRFFIEKMYALNGDVTPVLGRTFDWLPLLDSNQRHFG